ncbi:hypothetical protein ACERIM_02065 [Natrinema sp. H-ect1]|uniref:hypothetical protein n=1 Tax=Natrinema sp. H-ect1 TaxID=3242700 RepID=UPI00359D69C6
MFPLQNALQSPIPWGNDYITLIVTGLVVAYVVYLLGWNGGDDSKEKTDGGQDVDQDLNVDQNQEVGGQDVDQEVGAQDVDQEVGGQDVDQEVGAQDVDQETEQNVNQNVDVDVYAGDSDSGNEVESESQNPLDECLNCYPKNLEDGSIDTINDTRNEIPTFKSEGEAEVTVDWPSEQGPSWILVDGGTEVYVNFKDKPGNMDFDGKRFRVGENSNIEHFDIEFSAPTLSGTQEVQFQDLSTGDIIHTETLTRL